MRSNSVRIGAAVLALFMVVSTVACTTDQVLSEIETGLAIAGSLAPAIGSVSPADAAAVQILSGLGVSGLKAIQSDYDAWAHSGSSSALVKLQATANQVKATLPAQLESLKITDPNAVAKATNWVNLIVTSIDAVTAALPATSANPAELKTRALTSLPTSDSLKARWDAEVCKGNKACADLVRVKHAKQHGRVLHALTFGRLQ